jgi:hypothetical protein
MTRVERARWTTIAVMVAVAATLVGCGMQTAPPVERATMDVFKVGDCVEIPTGTPDAPGSLRAAEVPCSVDPSYTVGATADDSGACPSAEYQHISAETVDPTTSRLCLVPNLVANHCYVMDVPVGVMQRADCDERGQQGLLVQVTQRLDVRDQRACPSASGQFAWPYPSPARTYCTLTIY